MPTSIRETIESPLVQGENESIIYTLTTTPWGSSPASVAVKVYDVTAGDMTDVTTATLTGAATVSGDVITLPVVHDLTPLRVYRLAVTFSSGGNTFEAYSEIHAE